MIILFLCRKFKFFDNWFFNLVTMYIDERNIFQDDVRSKKLIDEKCRRDLQVKNKRIVLQPKGK